MTYLSKFAVQVVDLPVSYNNYYRKEHAEFYVATPYALANAQMVHAHVHTVRDMYRIISK